MANSQIVNIYNYINALVELLLNYYYYLKNEPAKKNTRKKRQMVEGI